MLYNSDDACPHCKKDRRNIEEILESIRDNYDELIDIGSNDFEFDSDSFTMDLTALSKHPAIQLDPIRLDMSKNVLAQFEECNELMVDYHELQGGDDLEIIVDNLNKIIPKIKKKVSKLIADYPTDFKFPL